MLLPFMNISSFLHNFEDIGNQLHLKINSYFLSMMMSMREQILLGDAASISKATK